MYVSLCLVSSLFYSFNLILTLLHHHFCLLSFAWPIFLKAITFRHWIVYIWSIQNFCMAFESKDLYLFSSYLLIFSYFPPCSLLLDFLKLFSPSLSFIARLSICFPFYAELENLGEYLDCIFPVTNCLHICVHSASQPGCCDSY